MQQYIEGWKKYVIFSGTASRTEFWLFILINFFILFICSMVFSSIENNVVDVVVGFFIISSIIPTLSVSVRRLHDVDMSGWWLLIGLIPFGFLGLFVFFILESKRENNKYIDKKNIINKPPTQKNDLIIKYLEENKNDYNPKELIIELEKAGYNTLEIQSGIKKVFEDDNTTTQEEDDQFDFLFKNNTKKETIENEIKKEKKETIFNKSRTLTIDYIIKKWFPVIGMLFVVGGLSYLFYDGLWKNINEMGRLGIGFIFGVLFIIGGYRFEDKLRGFGDVIIGGGILIMYVTLIYGSRFQDAASAVIPELFALVIALSFSISIAFYSYNRKSKYILILGVLGGYLTPFFVGRAGDFGNYLATENVFSYELGLPVFLIYFLAVGITIFLVSNKMFLKGIGLLNSLGLFIGTFLLVLFIGEDFTQNIELLAGFSVIVVIMHIAAMVVNAKKFEDETDPYLIAGYVLPFVWFVVMVNSFFENNFLDITNAGLFGAIAIAYFSSWYYLRNITNSDKHFTLYIGGQVSMIIGLTYIIPSLNEYQGLFLSLISLIFMMIYRVKPLISREISMLIFAFGGALFNLSVIKDISFSGIGGLSGSSIFIILTLLPFIFMSPMSKIVKHEGGLFTLRKILGYLASVLSVIILLVDILDWEKIPLDFLFLTIPALILVIVGFIEEIDKAKLKFFNAAVMIGTAGILHRLGVIFSDIIKASTENHFLATKESLVGITTLIILFLSVYGYKKLIEKNIIKKVPTIVIFDLYLVLLVVVTYEIIGVLNSLELDFSNQAIQGIRAFSITIWWAGLALWLLFSSELTKGLKDQKIIGFILLTVTIFKLVFYDLSNINTNLKVFLFIIIGAAITAVSYHANKKEINNKNL